MISGLPISCPQVSLNWETLIRVMRRLVLSLAGQLSSSDVMSVGMEKASVMGSRSVEVELVRSIEVGLSMPVGCGCGCGCGCMRDILMNYCEVLIRVRGDF